MSFRRRRSALYVPASNARAVDKTRTLPCDVVILDLEDAVVPESKAQAREQAVAAVRAGGFGEREVVVRINGLDTPWGAADLEAVAAARPAAILVPKVARRADLRAYERHLAVLDGVYNALDDREGLVAQCAQAVAFGFDGKTLIHPGQVEPCNQAFTPDAAAVAAAQRIVAAFAAPENAGLGALRVDGQMVERLHLVQARRTLAMAGVAA